MLLSISKDTSKKLQNNQLVTGVIFLIVSIKERIRAFRNYSLSSTRTSFQKTARHIIVFILTISNTISHSRTQIFVLNDLVRKALIFH